MQNLIIETRPKNNGKCIDAHVRNSVELSKIIDARIISTKEEIEDRPFKNIILSYGSYYFDFAPFLEFVKRFPQSTLWYVANEYNLSINGSFYKHFREHGYNVLANFVEDAYQHKKYSRFIQCNLNLLLFDPVTVEREKKYDLIYYGTFRKDRSKYFKKYFQNKQIYVSTSPKNVKRYLHLGCDAIWINKLNWTREYETLRSFRYSLYIEDEFTHSHYNHLANRFYEALNCQTVTFFDQSCRNTVEQSGIDCDDFFFVDSQEDLKKKISESKYEDLWSKQKKWIDQAKQEKADLIETLKGLFN